MPTPNKLYPPNDPFSSVSVDGEYRLKRALMQKVLWQLRQYAKEADAKGYTGPKWVYLNAVDRLKKDIIL